MKVKPLSSLAYNFQENYQEMESLKFS